METSTNKVQKLAISKLKAKVSNVNVRIVNDKSFIITNYNELLPQDRRPILQFLQRNRNLVNGMNGHGLIKNF